MSSDPSTLGLRIRGDLTMHALEFRGRRQWGVKDPVSLRYFQFRDEEYFILRQLDGTVDLETLQERFENRFAPRKLHTQQLLSFIGSLHGQGLLVVATEGQADELLRRRDEQRWRDRFQRVAGVLSIRFRGLDPDRFLSWLEPKTRWLFSWPVLGFAALLVMCAMLLATLEFDTMQAKLPDFHSFFSAKNAVYLMLTLACTKVLHEMGHALTCKRFGGECHELGLMLLVFTPCLYVNVTDAWMIRSKWRRAAIGAAGMAVELVLASVCMFLWWFSEKSLLHGLFLNVIFICSVSTLMFNGNPLLRYDGYYILADLIEVPNLHQQSTAVVVHYLGRWFLGVDYANERMLPDERRGWLAAFWAAAVAYRVFVLWMIAWVLHAALKPYGLEALVQVMVLVSIGGMLAGPMWNAITFLRNPGRTRDVKWLRFIGLSSLVLGAIALVAFFPFPYRVAATAMVEPDNARKVYVSTPGTLVSHVTLGSQIKADDVVAQLEDLELQRKLLELEGQAAQTRVKLTHLQKRRVVERPNESGQLSDADRLLLDVEKEIASLEAQIKEQEKRLSHLTIRAPAAGLVLPTRPRAEQPQGQAQLPQWSGSPLEPQNQGAFLSTGDELCMIGDPDRLEAMLLVDQADIKFVRAGQPVRIRLHQTPGETLWGKVVEISAADLDVLPPELTASGELATAPDKQGNPKLLAPAYQVRVVLDPHAEPLLLRSTGIAKIHSDPQSLGFRAYRYLAKTFRFDW